MTTVFWLVVAGLAAWGGYAVGRLHAPDAREAYEDGFDDGYVESEIEDDTGAS